MERKRINSSTIRSVGYDAGKQVLEIEFSSAHPQVHRRVARGASPLHELALAGKFYQDQIDESFPAKRIR